MRGQEFRARDKKVRKMSRDGLVEKNLTQGTEHRISKRQADINVSKSARKVPESLPGDRKKTRHPPGLRKKRRHVPYRGGEKSGTGRLPEAEKKRVVGRLPEVEKKRVDVFSAEPEPEKKVPRLRYGREESPPEWDKNARLKTSGPSKEPSGETGEKNRQGTSVRQKKFEKARSRLEKTKAGLEEAEAEIPFRRRVSFRKQYDAESGKAKRRLRFETEIVPEHEKQPLPKRAGKALGRAAATAAILKTHQKIREVEKDNVGVEAAHKVEFAAERMTGSLLRRRKRRLREKPYRAVRRAQKHLARANADMAYQKLLADNPELQKKAVSRWFQKQKIKRKYAAAVRAAEKETRHTLTAVSAAGKAFRVLAETVSARKTVLGIIGIAVMAVSISGAMFSSCSAMLSGVQSAVISTCYVADDAEINRSELAYTELETDLQLDIDNTEINYPGYDEYQYSIGEISHNPYELMGYLSAAYDAFTYGQVEAEILRVFAEQYQLAREEVVETRSYTDNDGNQHVYEWRILKTTLTARPLSEIIAENLPAGDASDRYGLYMQTCGNRQCFWNPFDVEWISHVVSPYGYRLNPSTGEKEPHQGIDIGMSEGTAVKATQDGRVIFAGNDGDYGLCVVIDGEYGYRSRYARCSSLAVSVGQEVKQGDVIAAVGSTGSGLGAYLHLEVSHNGEYLNPYYFVDNGGSGYTPEGNAEGMPVIPENPGAVMGDGSFEAMLAEAEKYLGFPYVWGGSSPATSFDCSGYVSWVINHSGVGNVGRPTAQGLYNICTPVSRENMRPGDLVFFTGTYSSAEPVTHVGIYVGGGRMIHAGSPISYADISNSAYWTGHFYSGGRLP